MGVPGVVLTLVVTLSHPVLCSGHAHTPMTTAQDPHDSAVTDLEPGEFYRGGTRIGIAAGTSFVIPPQWQGFIPPGSRTFYLESPTKPGIGLIAIIQDATPEELEDHLNEPQVIEEGYVLHPAGSATRTDRRITASYHSGENIGRALAFFGPSEQGLLFLFTGPKDETAYYESLLEQIAASTRFSTTERNSSTGREGT
jgi:hypothetical protein